MGTINVGRVSKTRPHLLADVVETLCAFELQSYSKTDLLTTISNATKPAEESLEFDDLDRDDDGVLDDESQPKNTQRNQAYVDEGFAQLEFRSKSLKNFYPFDLQSDYITLKRRLNWKHLYYLFLLAASRSRSFGSGRKTQEIASLFELVCRDSLRRLMNDRASVVMFGPTTRDRRVKFDSDLRKAIPKLAAFMGMDLSPKWDPSKIQPQGDGKIDLVGVQKLDDLGATGWNVFLAQCAAHEDEQSWERKKYESDISYHSSKFHYAVKSQSVLFVPGFFRDTNGSWAKDGPADGVILMDRVRILQHLKQSDSSSIRVKAFVQQNRTALLKAYS